MRLLRLQTLQLHYRTIIKVVFSFHVNHGVRNLKNLYGLANQAHKEHQQNGTKWETLKL